MMKKVLVAAALFLFTLTPVMGLQAAEKGGAMGGHGAGHEMGHDMSAGSDHAMGHHGMARIGEETVDGVKAAAQISDLREVMAKMGKKTTHHIMIAFSDITTGKPMEKGVVAMKAVPPGGEEGQAAPLMEMDGQFGGDITLDKPGAYKFILGTKLEDGKKRQFQFQYTVK